MNWSTAPDSAALDKTATCRVLQAASQFVSQQGHLLTPGISAQSVGAQRIHLQIATIPPGARAKAHKHADHETAIYVLSGESGMWYGDRLERHLVVRAGDFLYIPANVPHLPYNLSKLENCIAVIARTDPDEQESVVLLPKLDAVMSRTTLAEPAQILSSVECKQERSDENRPYQ